MCRRAKSEISERERTGDIEEESETEVAGGRGGGYRLCYRVELSMAGTRVICFIYTGKMNN